MSELILAPGGGPLERALPSEAALRARLPRAWYALFAHRTPLTPIQRRAILPLLDGVECLLVAGGDPGRLEALVSAPFEQIPRREVEAPLALLVCPDKPSVRSAMLHLAAPARRGELRVESWSGLQSEPPRGRHIVALTLRTLDGLLARRPAWLKHLRWALVDRLNRFEGMARADQLAAVLHRLRRVAAAGGGRLTVAMASGALADGEGAAARHLEQGRVITVPPSRQRVDVRAEPAPDLRTVVKSVSQRPGRSVVYAPYAREAEGLGEALRGKAPFGEAVYVRHGGLDAQAQSRAVRAFAARKTAALITTLPIEDEVARAVSRVVQWAPPPDVATLVARVDAGAQGPEADPLEVLLLPRSLSEAVRMAFLVERVSMDDWCVDRGAYHPGTLLQQACSLIFQNPRRRLTPKALLDRLPPWQARWWDAATVRGVLERGHRWFKADGRGGFLPSDRLEKRFESGRIHGLSGDLGISRQHQADAQAYLRFLGVPAGVGALIPGLWVHGLGSLYGRVIAGALRDLGIRVDGHSGMAIQAHGRPPPLDVLRVRGVIRREASWLTKITAQGPEFQWLPPALKARALAEAVPPEAVVEAWRRLQWQVPSPSLERRVTVALTSGFI